MTTRRAIANLDMLVLDRDSNVHLNRQLYNLMKRYILDGSIAPDTQLPSTRALSETLSISRNTTVAVYEILLAEGYIETRTGSGTWVADLPPSAIKHRNAVSALPSLSKRGQTMVSLPCDHTLPRQAAFLPGYPDLQSFPFSTWARLLKRHARDAREDIYGYHWITGHPNLKAAVASYLRVSRGVDCEAGQVIIVNGAQAALDILGRLLLNEGDAFCIEEPGYPRARSAFVAAGGRPAPLPVGLEGWQLGAIQRASPRLIYTTPSCQWPLGRVMRMEERLRLLQIADQCDSWIIEDDYDSEYRFRGRPVSAMQGLDRTGRVIYVGTFAKTLFPSLRIGFMVVPTMLVDGLERIVSNTGQYPPLLLQVALAEFMTEGHFASHIRRTRSLYAKRQERFLAVCDRYLSELITLGPSDGGMQLVGRFKSARDDLAVQREARKQGVTFTPLSPFYSHTPPVHGALLGYAGVPEDEMADGVRHLRTAILRVPAG